MQSDKNKTLKIILYLLFFGSIIAFTAYIWLLGTVDASKVATYSYVNPIIAVFLGWLIRSEPVTATMVVAMVIIVVAVFTITSRQPGQVTSSKIISERGMSPAQN
jgi:drug/metabolite transporter (DMT)-like permease